MFCDINDFDKLIAQEGKNVVKFLDYLYREFDGFCLENGVQKIEVKNKNFFFILNKFFFLKLSFQINYSIL